MHAESIPSADTPRGEARILVVDDNVVTRRFAQSCLRSLGLRADEVVSGQEALARIEQWRYELVLTDVELPDIDGFELAREIRRRERQRRTPIVALTARSRPDDRTRCLAAGMDGYVVKPLRFEALREVLRIHVDEPCPGDEAEALHLDLAWLRGCFPWDEQEPRTLLRMFASRGEELVGAMASAVAVRDLDALGFHAHALKGLSGIVGARVMHGLLSGDPATLVEALPKLEQELEELHKLIARVLAH